MTQDQIQMRQDQSLKNQGSSLLELCDLVVRKDSVEGHCKKGNITYTFTTKFHLIINLPIAEEREDGLLGGLVADIPWPVLIRLVLPLPRGSIPPLYMQR